MPIINSIIKGKEPVIDTLSVTPTTSAQTITAPAGTDGYNPVNVSAVTAAIDANIVAGNIKKDVTILGVTGSLESGITPTGTKSITANGVYDVTNFASADVQVPTSGPTYYIEKTKDANNVLQNGSTMINLSGIEDLSAYVLNYAFYNNTALTGSIDASSLKSISGERSLQNTFTSTNITGLDLGAVESITGNYACYQICQACSNLTSINLGSLKSIIGGYQIGYICQQAFMGCGISNINLGSLEIIYASTGASICSSMFRNCINVSNINVDSLVVIWGTNACSNMFDSINNINSVHLYSLKQISNNNVMSSTFQNCLNLQSIYFHALESISGTYTNQISNLISGITGCTIHFPSNLDPQGGSSMISSRSGYPNFGGTNTVLLFDLPSTKHLIGANTTEYQRNPKYDTATALAWRVKDTGSLPNLVIDWTAFYTNGTTDPVVGDTIYSDAACTTTVTTISTIS